MIGGRVLRLRWAARCVDCDRSMVPGDRAVWFHVEDVGRCMACAEPVQPVAAVTTTPPERPPVSRPSAVVDVDIVDAVVVPEAEPTQGERVPEPTAPSRAAGASAQAEYERRRAKERARRREHLPTLVALVVGAPLAGYIGTRVGVALVERLLRYTASAGSTGEVSDVRLADPALVHVAGIVVGVALLAVALKAVFARRQSTEAWRIGAEGERMTARALDKLPGSFCVLHDLPMPRSKANIDHVVVGPTGVFTVETKNYRNGVTIKNGQVFANGRRLGAVVQQARRQAAAIAEQTGAVVTPVVCVHGAGVTLAGRRQEPVVDGVRFCSGRRLLPAIEDHSADLDDVTVAEIVRSLA